jgi:hypothetical protein
MKSFGMSFRPILVFFFYFVLLLASTFWKEPSALAQSGHNLVAQYTFAANSQFYQADSSGNNNNINGGGSWENNPVWGFTTNAIAGGGALTLDGGEDLNFGTPPGNQTFDSWLATWYGSFSVSLWIDTTNIQGNDSDSLNCCNGTQIITAYNNGIDDTIPIALTGHKVAFFTGDPSGNNGDTLHSTNPVTTGTWVHIVVTRDAISGQKTIYVNGVYDSSDLGVTNHLDGDTQNYSVGGAPGDSYVGALDELQIYSGVLSASDVAYLYANPGLTLSNETSATTAPVAYYDFDEGVTLAADLTANGFNLVNGGNFGGPVISSDSVSGSGAVYFNGGSFLTPSANLLPTLAGDFSLSVWVKTSQSLGYDGEPPYQGAGIVAADISGPTNDIIPMALTGGGIGFNTGSATNGDDYINSATDINDGNYHHVVVTRSAGTGAKQIFIDGILSSSDTNNGGLLDAPELITIGALADASNPDPTSPGYTGYQGYVGLLDDLQIYSRVISSSEVSALYTHPGGNVTNGLVAHYDFDEGTAEAADVSGHGNDIVFAGYFNGPGPQLTTTAESGAGALSFDGGSYLEPNGNLVTNLAASFSVSVWLQTTQSLGAAGNPAYQGAGIITAEDASESHDVIPLALTGGNLAFETDGNNSDTLTSSEAINDGKYHHVVVTRDGVSGAKQIYIDGVLNANDVADTALLSNPQVLVLGALSDASQSDPNFPTANAYNGYVGLMDDLQIYPRVLSAGEITFLYQNPGTPLAASPGFGEALGQPGLTWTTSGATDWLVESTNTYALNAEAAQSGSLGNGQSSTLATTVTGPGLLSFYWENLAGNRDNFGLQFSIDGSLQEQITGATPWTLVTIPLTAGTHTLSWVAAGSSSPTDTAFVDQVVLGANPVPVITLNPNSQTNYPGYPVVLVAGANSTAVSWQWYKEGVGPLANATNSFFSPTNSGTAGVAGSYYAVASDAGGSANTSTAAVDFASSPLPPVWSRVFRNPYYSENDAPISDYNGGCVVDSAGDVYTANQYIGDVTVENNASATIKTLTAVGSDGGAALIKYLDTNGPINTAPIAWIVGLTNADPASYSFSDCVALAPGNGAYLASDLSGTNWLGTNKFSNNGGYSILLSRFDANGSNLWSRLIGTNNQVFLNGYNAMESDTNGNVTLAGIINGSADFGGKVLTGGSGYTGFLAQYDTNGALRWAESISEFPSSVASGNGQIFVSMASIVAGGVTNLSIGSVSNTTDRACGIGALSAATGQPLWVEALGEQYSAPGANGFNDAPQISVSGSDVYLTGTANGSSALFGNISVPFAGGRSQYFARYDTNGNPQVATALGSATTTFWAAAANSSGVYICGDFDGYSEFGNYFVVAPEYVPSYLGTNYFTQDFVAKLDRNGNPLWARNGVSPVLANFRGIATTTGGVWASGFLDVTNELINGQLTIVPALFGTNAIISDPVLEGSPVGSVVFFRGGMMAKISESEPASAVKLINIQGLATTLQFQFVSQAGYTNMIEYRTNLLAGSWQTTTNIPGDGTLKTVTIPLSLFSPSRQGFIRVQTH